MKEFARELRKKGWTQQAVADRWNITLGRVNQISANPTTRDQDALRGLPGNPDDPYNLDDIDDLFAAQAPTEVSSLILAASHKYKWSNAQVLALADDITSQICLAESTRRMNRKK